LNIYDVQFFLYFRFGIQDVHFGNALDCEIIKFSCLTIKDMQFSVLKYVEINFLGASESKLYNFAML